MAKATGHGDSLSMQAQKMRMRIAPYVFLFPNLLIFTVFIIYPAIMGFVYSFHDYDGLNPMEFIGIANYAHIFTDTAYWNTLIKTFTYVIITVPLIFTIALGIAMLLIREIRARGFFRAIFYWPVMISFIIVGLSWKWIFGESFGIVNHLLQLFGMEPIRWLTSSFYAKLTVIMATLWSRVGFFMVIFIAGLQSIPVEYYEAARIDGASKVEQFRNITMPLLKPTSFLVLLLSLIETVKQYPLMFALTGGGPAGATTYIVQYIYETGFTKQELGLASAMSIVLFVIISAVTIVQFRISKGGEIQ